MTFNFSGQKVLVTGGTRGIGAEIAAGFASAGAKVTITGTAASSLNEFTKKYKGLEVEFDAVDFSDLKSTEAFAKKVEVLAPEILINNAGLNKIELLNDIALEDWQRIQDVNLRAPFLLSQAAAKGMCKAGRGRIVNIASVFGIVTKEQRLSYSTSKFGLIGMTKNLALELAKFNILVNAISPGFIDTDLTRKTLGEAGIQEMVQKVPLLRLGQSKDIANLALFLSSDLNGFITGENIVIDGGFTCA